MSDEAFAYPKILEKFIKFLSNFDKKDIVFEFNGSDVKISAHKMILESISPVFAQMFSGVFLEKNRAVIHDIHPEVFQKLIDGIYMQPIHLEDVGQAFELYNAAEMYDVEDLKEIAQKFIESNVTLKDCLYLYDKARFFSMTSVIEKCREFIKKFPNVIPLTCLSLRDEIQEDTLVDFIAISRLPQIDLYQLLEYLVEVGRLKTHQKALSMIKFLRIPVTIITTAKLLTDIEKQAIIANRSNKKRTAKIPMPKYLSSSKTNDGELYYKIDTKYFWMMLLLKAPSPEYFDLQLNRVISLTEEFSSTELETIKEAFQRKVARKSLRKKDVKLLESVLPQNYWYQIRYEANNKMEIWYYYSGNEVFSYEFEE